MSRSYKKHHVIKSGGPVCKRFFKNRCNRLIRRCCDLDFFPHKGNRIKSHFISPWDINDCIWDCSFEQWMVRKCREYCQYIEVSEGKFGYGSSAWSKDRLRKAPPNRKEEFNIWKSMFMRK